MCGEREHTDHSCWEVRRDLRDHLAFDCFMENVGLQSRVYSLVPRLKRGHWSTLTPSGSGCKLIIAKNRQYLLNP